MEKSNRNWIDPGRGFFPPGGRVRVQMAPLGVKGPTSQLGKGSLLAFRLPRFSQVLGIWGVRKAQGVESETECPSPGGKERWHLGFPVVCWFRGFPLHYLQEPEVRMPNQSKPPKDNLSIHGLAFLNHAISVSPLCRMQARERQISEWCALTGVP